MANKWEVSLCKLPFDVTMELSQSLDADGGWERLAGAAGFNFDLIQQFRLELQRPDGSPTRKLLWEMGCRGCRVHDLYEKLEKAQRIKAKTVIEDYVNEPVGASAKGEFPSYSSSFSNMPSSSKGHLPDLMSILSRSNQGCSRSSNNFRSDVNLNRQYAGQLSSVKPGAAKNKIIPGTEYSGVSSSNNNSSSLPPSFPELLSNGVKQSDTGNSSGSVSLKPQTLFSASTSVSADILQKLVTSSQSASSNGQQAFPDSPVSSNTSPNTLQPSRQSSSGSATSETEFAMSVKASFTYAELDEATDGFSAQNLLGEGAFGTVFKASLRHHECAVKVLKKEEKDGVDNSFQLKNELTTLLKYQHENIVTLYGYALDGPHLCLVYQYLPNGSLEDRLLLKNGTAPLSWERRLNIMLGAAKGLNFLHTIGDTPLLHGDIKSANILLDKYFEAKVGDLGQAKYATSGSSTTSGITHITMAEASTKQFGTKAYLAQDVLRGSQLSTKSDIYAMGVVFLEVCTGLRAYDQSRMDHFLASHIKSIMEEISEGDWSREFQDQKAGAISADIFISVMKVAQKCVADMKKLRPDSLKLVNEIKKLYQKYEDSRQGSAMSSSSLSSDSAMPSSSIQLQISGSTLPQNGSLNSGLTGSDLFPAGSTPSSSMEGTISQQSSLQAGSSHSCYQSHFSHGQQSHELMAGISSLHIPVEASEETEPAVSIQKSQKDRIQELLHKEKPQPSHHSLKEETTVTHSDDELTSIDSPIRSFPPDQPLPEPFRLQAAYDQMREKREIKRLSEIQSFVRSDLENVSSVVTEGNSSPVDVNFDYIPPADPKKLAELAAFDKQNMGLSSESTEPEFRDLPPDPKKMAMLQNFDDDENSTTAEEPGTVGEEEGQVDASTSGPGTASTEYISCEEDLEHGNCDHRRPSDVDNTAVPEVDVSQPDQEPSLIDPGKKMMNFFNMYNQFAQQLPPDDEGDSNFDSLESRNIT